MKSLWSATEAKKFTNDPLKMRVYTSRLLGQDPSLVLHGGGNTSVKAAVKNAYGEREEIIYVKGSGWDLGTIEAAGFAPVKMDALLKMAEFERLSDSEMVKLQRAAMTDPYAPNPSVEAILHALIPYKFVDHTHADAVVTISNTPGGERRIEEIFGKKMLIVPYVMPGFILARKVYEMTRNTDWSRYEGMILQHHGIFTFHDDARESYERMIRWVSVAERYLIRHSRVSGGPARAALDSRFRGNDNDLVSLAELRQKVSQLKGQAMMACAKTDAASLAFSARPNVASLATRGPLTPDHVIRTKPTAAIIGDDVAAGVEEFATRYQKYFNQHKTSGLQCLDLAPRWAVRKNKGVVVFGQNYSEAQIISEIIDHTIGAVTQAEGLGGWKALPAKDIFDVEYWELEQAKLKKAGKPAPFQGKVALVTGAASGIGRACVEKFNAQGAAVVALDINPKIKELFQKKDILGLVCDMTKPQSIKDAVAQTIRQFGGLDIVVSNAGIFPPSLSIEAMTPSTWQKSMDINLTSHQVLLQECVPYLKLGIDASFIIIGSKNVPAPGPGASAYSVAKAGLTQLARVAALELAPAGIRVNVLHPNQVFDTAIWTDEVLSKRARHYAMTVQEYKTSNLLKAEITSANVADLVCVVAGPAFSKTTGAQIPIDGGNDRVI